MKGFSKGTIERLKLHVLQGRTSIEVFQEMLEELSSDLRRAKQDAHTLKEQYHKRIYLRTLMTYSEAILFRLKQHLLDQRDHLKINITENERLILNEQSLEIDDDGTLQRKSLSAPHEKNLKFTLKFIGRKLELTNQPNFEGIGWTNYKKIIVKRNELTHPKFPNDLKISSEELELIDSAEMWLEEEFIKLINGWAERARAQSIGTSLPEQVT